MFDIFNYEGIVLQLLGSVIMLFSAALELASSDILIASFDVEEVQKHVFCHLMSTQKQSVLAAARKHAVRVTAEKMYRTPAEAELPLLIGGMLKPVENDLWE